MKFRHLLLLVLATAFLLPGMTGCKSIGKGKNSDIGDRSKVIRRADPDSSTVSGFIGGERPSF